MFFLGGTFGGSAERTFNVPVGETLLIPVVNIVDFEIPGKYGAPPADPTNGDSALKNYMNGALDQWETGIDWKSLNLSVDGKKVHVDKHDLFRSNFFTIDTSKNGTVLRDIFGLGSTATEPSVVARAESDGVWVALGGLSKGEHTISFGGTVSGFTTQVTDHILVG